MKKDFEQLIQSILSSEPYKVTDERRNSVQNAHDFLKSFSSDKVIYGINTGFGPMAQYKIPKSDLSKLQYNLVRSHASGVGPVLDELQTRAVMICRLNTLTLGKSGVSMGVVDTLETYLNKGIYPEIYEKGGVGASGDLVQLAHLALGLIGEGYAYHKGERYKTNDLLKKLNVKPLELKLRDGLALINGTSCMSGIALLNVWNAQHLLDWSIKLSAMINELTASYNDSFSKELNAAKIHHGQQKVAEKMRDFLKDSKLIKRREDHLFKPSDADKSEEFVDKVQEYYSIRCVPQILGPVLDTIDNTKAVVVDEVNSANDNPITDTNAENVFHGGNFHGDYISFEMDKLKIAVTKMSMLLERQLNYILNDRLNGVFPPFLNKGIRGLNFGLQGMQFVATSTTAENQTLSNPMYVHSISCNNDNQDIVSMGMNSAKMTEKVIDNAYIVLAIEVVALVQAVDILGETEKIGSETKKIFDAIKGLAKGIDNDEPGFVRIQKVVDFLKTENLRS